MRLGVLGMLLLLIEVLVVRTSLVVEVHWRRQLLGGGFNHMRSGLVKNRVDEILWNVLVRWHWVMDRFGRHWAQDAELARILGCFFRCHVGEVRYAPTC